MFGGFKKYLVFCVSVCVGSAMLLAFDPGVGPGNIDARNNVAYVSQRYTFTDGCYARGAVYFQQGFITAPNSKVRFGVTTPVEGPCSFDITSTILLETPLYLGLSFGGYIAGTFMSAQSLGGIITISSLAPYWTMRGDRPAYFPGDTTINMNGQPLYLIQETRPAMFFGDRSSVGPKSTIQNARIFLSDTQSTVFPAFPHYYGDPVIYPLGLPGTASQQRLTFQDCSISIFEQASLKNMTIIFTGNCSIQNAYALVRNSIMQFDTPILDYVSLLSPASLSIGPDVVLKPGNYSGLSGEGTLSFWDTTITLSLPFTIIGLHAIVNGNVDVYSTAITPSNRMLSFGRLTTDPDVIFDIAPASQLNMHNVVLRNNTLS